MGDPVPSSAISDATTGGLSVIVITGGSTGQVLTLQANGTYAPATASGGSPGGSSGQVQYNNAGSFGGMTAVVYAATGAHVAITSQGATIIPLCVKGAASQSGNLTEWQNSSGTILSRIDSTGTLKSAASVALETTGYVYINNGGIATPYVSFLSAWTCTQGFTGGINLASGNRIVWGSSTINNTLSGTSGDVGLIRNAAGVIEVNSGTTGAFRDLKLRDLTASGLICAGTYTAGTLPIAAANAYKFATVSDSSVTTFGSTVAGGGSSKVQVYSNGTNWTVCGI